LTLGFCTLALAATGFSRPQSFEGMNGQAFASISRSALTPEADPCVELCLGADVVLAEHTFRIKAKLGTGSQGSVWSAECPGMGKVVIKELICRSQEALEDAISEVRTLLDLAPKRILNIPSYIASDEKAGLDEWRVRLAMSRVPGQRLDQFLEKRCMLQPADWDFLGYIGDAFKLTHEMLLQLAHAFDAFSSNIQHGDVTTHNILVEDLGGQAPPSFGLVDFGFAVSTIQWQTETWRTDRVFGDCRYWPVSTWFMFAHGPAEIEKHPELVQERKFHRDMHALGVAALELLMTLLSPPSALNVVVPADYLTAMSALRALEVAWQKYWKDVCLYWQQLYGVFQRRGDFAAYRSAYVGTHDVVREDLHDLRHAISCFRDAHTPLPIKAAGVESVMEVLLAMISCGDTSYTKTSWWQIRQLLEARHAHMAKGVSTSRHLCMASPRSYQSSEVCSVTSPVSESAMRHRSVGGKLSRRLQQNGLSAHAAPPHEFTCHQGRLALASGVEHSQGQHCKRLSLSRRRAARSPTASRLRNGAASARSRRFGDGAWDLNVCNAGVATSIALSQPCLGHCASP